MRLRKLGVVLWLALCVGCGSAESSPNDDEDTDRVGDFETDGGDIDTSIADNDVTDDDGDMGPGDTGDQEPELPRDGFGQISDDCPSIMADMLSAPDASLVRLAIDFGTDAFDAETDLDALTAGGQTIYGDGVRSSASSEAFAFEALNRCDVATLVKTEDQIVYEDTDGQKTDFSVSIGTTKLGVSVVRAFAFPFGDPYEVSDASPVLDGKLDDILLSSANVVTADAWTKQVLVVVAWDSAAADSIETAWAGLDDTTRADTIVYVVVTNGADYPIYGAPPP